MYIILRKGQPLCWEKFSTIYDAKLWCLHNGFAYYKTINKLGDKIILLYPSIMIEKIA